jgi:serine protease inhibitor
MNDKKRTIPFALAIAATLVVAGSSCSRTVAPMGKSEDALAVAKDCNAFATDLYARLSSEKTGNLFFSPYSVSLALAMTYAGAEGETQTEMAKVLHFAPEMNVAQSFGALRTRLDSGDKNAGFQLRVANRLWGQQGFRFLPAFVEVTRDNFGADVGQLDFRKTENARKTINAWVEQQTDHKIQDLLAPGVIEAGTRLVLTNAIYFKSPWTHRFEKSATSDAPFHTSASDEISVPTMHQTHGLRYAADDDVQVLELPYARDGSLSMIILLPKQVDGLADLEKRLTAENLQTWTDELQPQRVAVWLPKFKMTSEFSLSDALKAMGMPLAFSDQADFSGMSTQERLFISAVIHKAFVDVDEEGTEAAAATAVAVMKSATARPAEDSIEFRADHPFVFLIRDQRTQSILFFGRVVKAG